MVEKGVDKEILDAASSKPPQTSHGVAISTLLKKQTENELVGSSYHPKKKRKLWTKEEDKELIAAVRKFGEGNWVNILRENLKLDRTPSQLSQVLNMFFFSHLRGHNISFLLFFLFVVLMADKILQQ